MIRKIWYSVSGAFHEISDCVFFKKYKINFLILGFFVMSILIAGCMSKIPDNNSSNHEAYPSNNNFSDPNLPAVDGISKNSEMTRGGLQLTHNAGWSARMGQSGVILPDGEIIIMGGQDGNGFNNDVWLLKDKVSTWELINESAGWSKRTEHCSVVMSDGSIILMGGLNNLMQKTNDVWRSIDGGNTWTVMTPHAEWPARTAHSCVAMPDNTVVLMGGRDNQGDKNDVWCSVDNGATWALMNANPAWSPRFYHSSVAMADGSIVLMGGGPYPGQIKMNDVWRSVDNGATWTLVNASAGWSERYSHSSIVTPDGSIVLTGGFDTYRLKNDTWLSTNHGATWTQITPDSGWPERFGHSSVAMPDGSVIVMGGQTSGCIYTNDVWQLEL